MEYLEENQNKEIKTKNGEEMSQSKEIQNPLILEKENQNNNINGKKHNQSSMVKNNTNDSLNNKIHSNGKISAKTKIRDIASKRLNKSIDSPKNEKKQKINDILSGLKLKNNYQISPYTDLKSFGELTPGPGQYYNPETKCGQSYNLRYNNLFKDTDQNLVLKYKLMKDNYYQNKIGPGTYNLRLSFDHKSYSQNPKTFFSKLERGPLFKVTDSVGPAYYNPDKTIIKKEKNTNKSKPKKKDNYILKTEPFFQPNNKKILNSYNFNNRNKISNGKISFKGIKNFSWKGISDFSELGIKSTNNENKEMTKDDKIEYKNQEFNFDNQKKLDVNKNKISKATKKIIQKEISEYNKFNKPLIEYVPKDVVLKGNHLPGPCYYNYTNDSIEGDIKELNKKNKNNLIKKWK